MSYEFSELADWYYNDWMKRWSKREPRNKPPKLGLGKPKTYIVQNVQTKRVKIGFTRREGLERIAQVQVGADSKLKLLGIIDGNVERKLHKRFKKYRVLREWFEIPEQELKALLGDSVAFEIRGGLLFELPELQSL